MVLRVLIAVGLALVMVILTAVGVGTLLWSRRTDALAHRILQKAQPPSIDTAVSVPPPVRRYLELAVPGGAPPIGTARLEQRGEFLMRAPDGWAPFTATQLFTASPPAMLWDATIRMAPLLGVRVRDSYHDGVGSMRGAVLGLFNVLEEGGTDEMAEASLLRYLAESPWLPTRLLPSPSLTWTPVDDSTTLATLTDDGVSVSLEFRFAPDGEIRQVFADRRFRGKDETPRWAPWIGRFDQYEWVGGFRIPTRGEVAWIIHGEEQPYWRGHIESATYDPLGPP